MNQVIPVCVGDLLFGSGIPYICVPITGRDREEIIRQAKKIRDAAPDLVEWRVDLFEAHSDIRLVLDVLKMISAILENIPLIFTFRTQQEGGGAQISIEDYRNLNLSAAASAYVQMVDVEVFMDQNRMGHLIDEIHQEGKKVISSHHRFTKTPSKEEIVRILKDEEKCGGDILKLAVMPTDEADVQRLLDATQEAVLHEVERPVVTMSMGERGVRTRIEGSRYGSAMTFGCVGEASAPGQMELTELRLAMKNIKK